jgi:hypothetical protein
MQFGRFAFGELLVQVVRPPLHHHLTLGQVLCMIVRRRPLYRAFGGRVASQCVSHQSRSRAESWMPAHGTRGQSFDLCNPVDITQL